MTTYLEDAAYQQILIFAFNQEALKSAKVKKPAAKKTSKILAPGARFPG